MSKRDGKHYSEMVRDRIKASCLIDRLNHFVNGTIDPRTKKCVELSGPQVTAALGMLKKIVPDLQAIEHSGELTGVLQQVSDKPLSDLEWAAKYGAQASTATH